MGTLGHYDKPHRPQWAGEGVTDANGIVTLTFPAGRFSGPPVATVARRGASTTTAYDFSVTALSASGITVAVRKAVPLVVLGLSVLGASVVAAGETICVHAKNAG